ncbi:MAG: hypothetical protein H7Y27_08435 [Gemmatimonadaceae bacterium]|nr:hypothetical protein [Chitinophagaceae bacterium]
MKFIRTILLILLLTGTATAQVDRMNSLAGAGPTIFLDFDGQFVSGTIWNWNGSINAQPAALNAGAISEIFNRVAEDFRPFEINVTTDSAAYWNAPDNLRMRVIVTPTSSWYGSAGGVAFVGSFTWGDNNPCWVFSTLLQNNSKYVAEAISHEAGHTLGLQHHSSYDSNCNKIAEYSIGQGVGEVGWAPIMGAGYYENLTTWHHGANTQGCNYIQNDFEIITSYNGISLRSDDHGDGPASATGVNIFGGFFSIAGNISTTQDHDAFKIVLPTSNHFRISAIPQNVGIGNEGANIDIKIWMLNGTDTIGNYNPSTLLNAGIDTNLNAGTYYLVIDGVGNEFHNDFGSMGIFQLNGMVETVLGVNYLDLNGVAGANQTHQFAWSFRTDEMVNSIVIESSRDAKNFTRLVSLAGEENHYMYKPASEGIVYYRLLVQTASNPGGFVSNIIALDAKQNGRAVRIIQASAQTLTVTSNGNHPYQVLSMSGQIMGKGKLTSGINILHVSGGKGLMLLRYQDHNGVYTEKFTIQ